jgi:hypothetical protein
MAVLDGMGEGGGWELRKFNFQQPVYRKNVLFTVYSTFSGLLHRSLTKYPLPLPLPPLPLPSPSLAHLMKIKGE